MNDNLDREQIQRAYALKSAANALASMTADPKVLLAIALWVYEGGDEPDAEDDATWAATPLWLRNLTTSGALDGKDGVSRLEAAFNFYEGFSDQECDTEQFHKLAVKDLEVGMLTTSHRVSAPPRLEERMQPDGTKEVEAFLRLASRGPRYAKSEMYWDPDKEIDIVCPGCTIAYRIKQDLAK